MAENSRRRDLFVLVFFVVLLSTSFIFVLENVPAHRIGQAGWFFALAGFVGTVAIFLWLRNFRRFVLMSWVVLLLLPYFEHFLAPFFGEKSLQILPQLFLLALVLIGYMRRRKHIKVGFLTQFLLIWLVANIVSLVLSNDISKSLPPFLVGVVGPCLYTIIIHDLFLKDRAGFVRVINLFWISFAVYVLFSFLTTSANLLGQSFTEVYESGFGDRFAIGPYGSNGFPGTTAFVMPFLLWVTCRGSVTVTAPRTLVGALSALSMTMLFLIGSRGGTLLSFFYIFLIFWYIFFSVGLHSRDVFLSSRIRGAILSAVVLIPVFFFLSNPDYLNFMLKDFWIEHGFNVDAILQLYQENIRMILWEGGLLIFRANWFSGVGLGNIRPEMQQMVGLDFDSHNVMLDVFAEQGLVAGVAIFAIFVVCVWRAARMHFYAKNEASKLNLSLCIGTVAYFIYGAVLTGGKLITSEVTISGFWCYFLFLSLALQDYLWRESGLSKVKRSKRNQVPRIP